MKKSAVLLALVSVFSVGLVACNGGSGPTGSAPTFTDTPVPEPSITPMPTDTPTMELTATMEATVPPEFVGVTPITDFDKVAAVFESQELGVTVQYPLGWTAKQNLDILKEKVEHVTASFDFGEVLKQAAERYKR